MKQIITCIALLIVANSAYSQQNTPAKPMTKQDYLQKSKNQKTAAWILMGGGLGVTILGLTSENSGDNNSGNSGRAVGIITGVSAMSVSTALFIAATKNKNKAQALGFKMERSQYVEKGSFVYRSFPALSFRVNLQ